MSAPSKTYAITGAGGFIGRRLARRLIADGHAVRAADLHPGGLVELAHDGAWTLCGDVRSGEAMNTLCRGADVVIHTAAMMEEEGEMEVFRDVNVVGTRTVARAAMAAGASAFIHLSSVMVYGFTYPPDVTEEGPFRGENNPYCQTKIESEAALLEETADHPIKAVIIRPGDVYGPDSVPWVVRPAELIRQRLFMLPDGGRAILNHTHVENLVDGILAAAARGGDGEAYNITDGEGVTYKEFYDRLSSMLGYGPVRTLPASVMRTAFRALAGGFDLVGIKPPARPAGVEFINRPHRYSIAKAQRELDYAPRITLDKGFDELAEALATC